MSTQILNHGSSFAPFDRIWAGVRTAFSRIQNYENKRIAEAALADLTIEQLDDIGIRSSKDTRPLIKVEAGLMANLMSLR